MVESMAGGASGAGQNAKVAGGLMQELQNRPGGISSLVQMFHHNGAGEAAQQWAGGQTQPADPQTVQQGMGSGMIDSIAQRTGLSSGAVKAGLAVIVPLAIHHLAANGHVNPNGEPTGNQPEAGGMLQSVLGRFL